MLAVLTSALEKEAENAQTGKKRKLSLFTDDMMISVENLKESAKKSARIYNSVYQDLKICIQKSSLVLQTSNKESEIFKF